MQKIEVDMDLFSRRIGPYFSWIESKIESGWMQNDGRTTLLKKAKELSINMRARFITGISIDELKEEINIFEEFFNLALDKFPDYSDEIETKLEHFYKGIRAEVGEEILNAKPVRKERPKIEIRPLKEKPKIIGLKPKIKEPKPEESAPKIKETPKIIKKKAVKKKAVIKKKKIKKAETKAEIEGEKAPEVIKTEEPKAQETQRISGPRKSFGFSREEKAFEIKKPKKKKGSFFSRIIKKILYGEE